MLNLEQFSVEFSKRHDFVYDDSDYLPKKYYYVAFKNIPEAWVCPIDHCLEKLEEPVKIFGISQYCGLLVIEYEDVSDHDLKLLNRLEDTLRTLDLDLHEQLENGIGTH